MVEFALVMSFVFIPLLLGTFDIVRAYLGFTVATNVTREISRYAAAHSGDAGGLPATGSAAVKAGMNLAVGIDSSQLTAPQLAQTTVAGVTYDPTALPYAPPYITVTAVYSYHPVMPMLGGLFHDQTISVTTLVG
jgi:Flp pilus assembly protein TadG